MKPIGGGNFRPYICPAGVLTIGWGHTNGRGRKFDAHSVWTQKDCDEALSEDMRDFEAAVKRLVKVDLDQHQFDALVSFAYNAGEGALAKSTLLKKVNRKDFDAAAREFAKWNKAHVHGQLKALPGLTRRRAAEAQLFQNVLHVRSTIHDAAADTNPLPQEVAPPEPEKPIGKSKIVWTGGAIAAEGVRETVSSVSDSVSQVKDAATSVAEVKEAASSLGVFDLIERAITNFSINPKILIGIALTVGAVAIVCWRWRIHQNAA